MRKSIVVILNQLNIKNNKIDKDNFKKILKEVIDADLEKYPDLRLLNSFAKKYAEELLNKIDEIFYF